MIIPPVKKEFTLENLNYVRRRNFINVCFESQYQVELERGKSCPEKMTMSLMRIIICELKWNCFVAESVAPSIDFRYRLLSDYWKPNVGSEIVISIV